MCLDWRQVWIGPDTVGKTFVENPLVPAVRAFYLGYTDALLAEYGGEIDAMVWDTTSFVGAASLGSAEFAGYADRAMMKLMRDVALKVQDYNRA